MNEQDRAKRYRYHVRKIDAEGRLLAEFECDVLPADVMEVDAGGLVSVQTNEAIPERLPDGSVIYSGGMKFTKLSGSWLWSS